MMKMENTIKEQLNPEQWEAVSYLDGPLQVIAGAGSGKTRVLTFRIAYLIQQGIAPESILALTFTNKAAREMNSRIASIVGWEQARGLWSGTFHSIFARILRREAESVGYTTNFTIYDSTDSRSLIKSIVKAEGLDDKIYKPSTVAARISEAKNNLVLPDAYASDSSIYERDRRENMPKVAAIYSEYCKRCRQSNAMDFDDLLLNTYLLFNSHPEIRDNYAGRFTYILVDEYQDTNSAQHRIIRQLTKPDSKICVVGDDAQSIYAFRGARIDNILQFRQQYPGAKLVKLERNYRSTQTIVDAANSIIRHNANQIEKKVYSENEIGKPIAVFANERDKEEAERVAREVVRLHEKENVEYDEIALLYRTNAQSRQFEEAFSLAGIPYKIYGGLSFYQRKEVKDIICYFRLVSNHYDDEAFDRIINFPSRKIGKTSTDKIAQAAIKHGVSHWEVARKATYYGLVIPSRTLNAINGFCDMIDKFSGLLPVMGGYNLAINIVKESGISADIYSGTDVESLSKQQNVEELMNAIKSNEIEKTEPGSNEIVPLTDFLSQVSLLTDADQEESGGKEVTLMTVHAAKGLEFDAVFITGMEQDLFPNMNASFFPAEMEEERRLFYVAVTRAKRFCYLSYSKMRFKYGKMEFCEPSMFLRDIDSKYLSGQIVGGARRERPATGYGAGPGTARYDLFGGSGSTVPTSRNINTRFGRTKTPIDKAMQKVGNGKSGTSGSNLSVGQRISHERFGEGVVVSVSGQGSSAMACVEFATAGKKNLLLKFAKFKLL